MNKKLVLIYDDKKMFFSFEKNNFKIGKSIGEGEVYSSYFNDLVFEFSDEKVMVNNNEILYDQVQPVDNFCVYVSNEIEYKSYLINKAIIIGEDIDNCDIQIAVKDPMIIKKHKDFYLLSTSSPIFLNGEKRSGEIEIHKGDYLLIGNELLFLTAKGIKLREHVACKLMDDFSDVMKSNYNSYHRSPRLFHKANTDSIKVEAPPQKPKKEEKTLMKVIVPPLIMLSITVGISVLIGRGLFVVISIAATLMSIIKSIQTFFDGRKKYKEETEKRTINYDNYLTKKSVEINLRVQEEMDVCNYHILSPNELISLVNNESRRIFEKSMKDNDFLTLRIGAQNREPSFKVELPEQKINEDFDELYEVAQTMTKSFNDLIGVGLNIDLRRANVGLIGTKDLCLLVVKQMLLEVMTFHSYHDVQLMTIFHQDYLKELEWLGYAPHSKIDAVNIRGLIYSEVQRDQVLGSFAQIIKDREQKFKEDDKVVFSPNYVVTILSSELVNEHSIMEYFDQNLLHLGINIIIVENEIENLKENIDTVVEVYSRNRSRLLVDQGEYVKKNFAIDDIPTNAELLKHARSLKGYNHTLRSENGLPKMITFLEMYGVDKIEDLNIANRWKQNDSTKTLAVRLGVNGDDYVELNLHEKAHGPHGLVAGTTGSGKSEIVQSYILSLAINFSPYEVGFLLIDYKGGGMANLFKDLPHLIGTITNLDGAGSMRALVSIKAELLRRQEIFSKYNVNHINQYIHLFKEGKAEEPMPHLFMISDEFAELKSEQPEFMKELVSTARIGRSLGIHLILATQKPSGVVDSQIWSNSKFKLCLKVQDEADSKEMLKTGDAAHIVEPGRAYLQVGNNEIYELFQSAWSGADYVGEREEVKIDKRIYQVNRLGQQKLLTKDLSGNKVGGIVEKANTELEMVVKGVGDTFEQLNYQRVKKIWLEDLCDKYYLDDYMETDFDLGNEKVLLGIVDIPSQQKQVLVEEPLTELGNFVILGSSGYGKSYSLMSALLSLFSRNNADQVYSYILDFGNNSLINLKPLPHVADYISVEDEDKINKFMKVISEEMNKRKKLFSEAGANHIVVYNELVEKKLPKVVVGLDNFDAVKEEFPDLSEFLIKVLRDCTSLGIYFMCTASRIAAFRSSMVNSFKTKISLYNIDRHEYNTIVGRSEFLPKDQPGNALIKFDGTVAVMQIFLPAKAESDVAMVKAINEKVEYICANYTGGTPGGIAVVNEDISAKDILEQVVRKPNELVIGMDYESVQPVIVNTDEISILSIVSAPNLGKTNLVQFMLMQHVENAVILDGKNSSLSAYKDENEYFNLSDGDIIFEKITNDEFTDKILITDAGDEMLSNFKLSQLEEITSKLMEGKFKLIIAFNATSIKLYSDALTKMLKVNTRNIVQTMPDDQKIVEFAYKEKKALTMKLGDAVYSNSGIKRKIRVPNIGEKS